MPSIGVVLSRVMIRRLAVLAGLVLCWASAEVLAQSAAAPAYPPSNMELRLQEFAAEQRRQSEVRRQTAESRLRRLTGSGQAAGTEQATASSLGSIQAARIAIQAAVAATRGMFAISAAADEAPLLISASSDGGSPPATGTGDGTTISTSVTTSTSTSTSTATATQ